MNESEMVRMTRASQALLKALDTLRNVSLAEIDAYLAHVEEGPRVTRTEAEAFAEQIAKEYIRDDQETFYFRAFDRLIDFIYSKVE